MTQVFWFVESVEVKLELERTAVELVELLERVETLLLTLTLRIQRIFTLIEFLSFFCKKKKKLFTWNYCEIAKMKQETKKKKSLIFCNWKNFHQVIFTAAWRKLKFPSLCNTYSAYCCLIEWIIIKMTDPLFLNTFIECPFVTLDV